MTNAIELAVCGATDVGRQRTNNEDALLIADGESRDAQGGPALRRFDVTNRPVLLAVADGMGGENAGEVASQLALTSFCDAFEHDIDRGVHIDSLRAAIERSNEVVTEAAKAPGREGMGATLAVALVHGSQAFIVGVGDSRVYILRSNRLVQVTRDQSMLQYLIDSGSIAQEQIASFPMKNVIIQAIGRAPNLAFGIASIDLRHGDVLLLCSDGLSGEVDDEAIRNVLASFPVDVACGQLIAKANEGGGRDNITAIVAAVSGESLGDPAPEDIVTPVPFLTIKAGS